MKSTALITFVALILAGQDTISAQAPNQASDNQTQQRRERYQQVLQRFDANKNGRLDPDELAKARQAFQQRQQQNRPMTNTPNQPANNTARQDKNSQFYRQLLQRFDKNGDGRLSGDELQAARQARNQMQGNQRGGQLAGRLLFNLGIRKNRLDSSKLMSDFDVNGDGELNSAERRSAIQALENK